jgi:hypothetical protein
MRQILQKHFPQKTSVNVHTGDEAPLSWQAAIFIGTAVKISNLAFLYHYKFRHLQRVVEMVMVVFCENLIQHTTRSECKCLNVRRYIDSPLCFKGLSALKGAYCSLPCSHKTINLHYLEAVQYSPQRHISASNIPIHFHINFPSWSPIEIFFLQIYLLFRVSRM